MRIKILFFASVLTLILCACSKTTEKVAQPIVNLVEMAYHYSEQPESILQENESAIDALLKVVGDTTLEEWSHSRAVVIFSPDVNRVYPSLEPIEYDLGHILRRAEELNLSLPKREYAAVAYGKPESIMFVDSVMLIALNHYLGADYPGYAGLPEYVKSQKTPEQLPYAIAEALCGTQYPFVDSEQPTLLNHMLYDGALVWYKLALVKGSSPAAALGYSEEEYRQLIKDERTIWEKIVQQKLLYDTSEMTIGRFCSPAPFVQLDGVRYPGRVGRFIGWRIVEKYLEKHPKTNILTPSFYNSDNILLEAKM